MYIFTLTMVKGYPKEEFYDTHIMNPYKKPRCVGWFKTFDDVLPYINDEKYYIWENGYYKYAVIETIGKGLHSVDSNPIWFNKQGVQIPIPEEWKNVYCIGIG